MHASLLSRVSLRAHLNLRPQLSIRSISTSKAASVSSYTQPHSHSHSHSHSQSQVQSRSLLSASHLHRSLLFSSSSCRRYMSTETTETVKPEIIREKNNTVNNTAQPSAKNVEDDDAWGSELGSEVNGENVNVSSQTPAAPIDSAKPKGSTEKMSFQAETRQILDIVTNSLYTDKEVFVREIISNASDALEKARYLSSSGIISSLSDPDLPFEIRLTVDEANSTLTLQDFGIGMTKEEIVSNIGTIARSGSKQFVKEVAGKGKDAATNIIGQFGVGFYSTFMVASRVEVYTKSANADKASSSHYWVSDGTGSYDLSEADGVVRGTKVILHLKEEHKEFASKHVIEGIIKKHSNFVGFPIFLNGVRIPTTGAVWLQDKSTVTDEAYLDFYRHIAAGSYDTPSYRLHFSVDAPIAAHALLFFGERHTEKFGMGRMDPGVSVYSRKVLIKPKSEDILPGWLRFVKGVVDSEDLPLNISRESMQDSRLMSRLNYMLTRRIIKFLDEESKKDAKKFAIWYKEFGVFLKEGACSDQTHQKEIAKLLRFDSSVNVKNDVALPGSTVSAVDDQTSLDEYVGRMPPDQSAIYYLNAPDRSAALKSPYYEACKQRNREVLFLYNPLDDMCLKTLNEFNKRKFISIDSSEMDLKIDAKDQTNSVNEHDLLPYLQTILADKTTSIVAASRFFTVPALIVDVESSGVRKMMKLMQSESGGVSLPRLQKYKLEVNLQHPVWKKVLALKDVNSSLSSLAVLQIFDNVCISADLIDSPLELLPRLNKLVDAVLEQQQSIPKITSSSSDTSSDSTTTTTSSAN